MFLSTQMYFEKTGVYLELVRLIDGCGKGGGQILFLPLLLDSANEDK